MMPPEGKPEQRIALVDTLRRLAINTRLRLDETYDFYSHTKSAWRSLQARSRRQGVSISILNRSTGVVLDGNNFAARSQLYIERLAASTLNDFSSIFESFIFAAMEEWLCVFPHVLAKKTVEARTILDAPDKETVVRALARHELNELRYKRLADWFRFLHKLVAIETPSPEQISLLAEYRATRDVLLHNGGIVNNAYTIKSGNKARFRSGERIDVPEAYHAEVWQTMTMVVERLADELVGKLVASEGA